PIAILLYTLAWQRDGQRGPKASGRIALFTALVLANLIVVTALFTASVAGSNSTESATRLHMRYYNFALPLLPILAVSYLSSERASWAPWKKMLIGLPLIGIGLFAAFTQLYPFTPSFV